MNESRPSVLLALSQPVEQRIQSLLFGDHAVVTVAVSLVELGGLERTLDEQTVAQALLVSADMPGLSAGLLSAARSRGLRLVGVATDDHDARLLDELPLDATLTVPIDSETLQTTLTSPAVTETRSRTADEDGRAERGGAAESRRQGTVVAVIGSRGAPGSSELAYSLAALGDARWETLLVELDLLGGGLAVRLGTSSAQGSLLGLVRAGRDQAAAVGELLDRWLVDRAGWPPLLLSPPRDALAELDQPGAVRRALDALANRASLVVVDVGFLLDHPGQLGPVERCHREALVAADAVVLVLGARETQLDAGLAQLDLLIGQLGIPAERIRVVCNGAGAPSTPNNDQLTQTLTLALHERQLATDAVLPWDSRALVRAARTGLPLVVAHGRGGYARAVGRLLELLFLPGAPIARSRKRLLAMPNAKRADAATVSVLPVRQDGEEEVVLPWRR